MGLFTKKQTDLDALLSTVKVGNVEVKPFSLLQAEELLPEIQAIIAELKAEKITLKNLEKNIVKATQIVLPRVKTVLGDMLCMEIHEVESMPLVQVASIVLVVIRQNSDVLKNLIPLTQEILNRK